MAGLRSRLIPKKLVAVALTLATLLLFPIFVPSVTAEAQPRHPVVLEDPVEALVSSRVAIVLDYSVYACIASNLYPVMSSPIYMDIVLHDLPELSSEEKLALVIMLDSAERLTQLGTQGAFISPEEAKQVLEYAKEPLKNRFLMLVAYGFDQNKRFASTTLVVSGCGEVISGPASHVVLTLVNAIIVEDLAVLIPISSHVKLETGSPTDSEIPANPALARDFSEKLRSELFPEDLQYEAPPDGGLAEGPGEGVEVAEGSGGDNDKSESVFDASWLLRELARQLNAAAIEGGFGSGGISPVGGSVSEARVSGRIAGVIDVGYEDIARISEILNIEFPLSSVEGGGSPGALVVPEGESYGVVEGIAVVAALSLALGLAVVSVAYAPRALPIARRVLLRVTGRLSNYEDVIECYWEAVDHLGNVAGKMPWETPREHLERVRGVLGPGSERYLAFSRIVNVYEIVRYGGVEPSREMVDECRSSLRVVKSGS